MKKISIIIPSYNSADVLEVNLPYLKNYCDKLPDVVEIIIIDDGSQDSEKCEIVANKNQVFYYSYPNNLGKGGAVRYGVGKASGDLIFYTDADIPFETDVIEKAIHYLSFKEYDLVIGDRGLEASEYFSKISNKRRFGSGFFTLIVGRFITTGFSDTQCGFKGFRKEIAADLFNKSILNGFAFDVELIYIALKRNYDIKKIPVILRSQDGNSVSVLKHGIGMLFDIFKIKINQLKGFYKL